MIRINLLPFRAVRKIENVRRQVSIFFFSLIFIALALYYYNGILADKIASLESRISQVKMEITRYEKIVAEIKDLKKTLEILNRKIDVIQKLDANRLRSVRLLDSMTQIIVPQRMWFTDFKESGGNVEVSGIAIDNKTIADFMTRLETAYVGVSLQNLKQMRMRDVNLKSFNIKFREGTPKKAASENKASK